MGVNRGVNGDESRGLNGGERVLSVMFSGFFVLFVCAARFVDGG